MRVKSDLQFLKELHFSSESLDGLNDKSPIYYISANASYGIDNTLLWYDKNIRLFTHDLTNSINEMLQDFDNKIPSEIKDGSVFQIFKDTKKWKKLYSPENSGGFSFDSSKFSSIYQSLSVSKIKISQLNDLNSLIDETKRIEPITSGQDLFENYIRQGIAFIINNRNCINEFMEIPSVEEMIAKKDRFKELFEKYSEIPIGSIMQVKGRKSIDYIFGKKTSKIFSPWSSQYANFNNYSTGIRANTFLFKAEDENERRYCFRPMEVKLLQSFPLNNTIEAFSFKEGKKMIKDIIENPNNEIVVSNYDDHLVRKYENNPKKRIYKALNL